MRGRHSKDWQRRVLFGIVEDIAIARHSVVNIKLAILVDESPPVVPRRLAEA